MKAMVVKIAVLSLVISQAATAQVRAGARDAVRDSKTNTTVQAAAGRESKQAAVKAEIKDLSARGWKISNETNLENVLMENPIIKGTVLVEKNGKTETKTEEISARDIVTQLKRVNSSSGQERMQAVESVLNLMAEMGARGEKKSSSLDKLILEAVDVVTVNTKATSTQINSFSNKCASILKALKDGDATDVDAAAEKALTKQQKEDLEKCVRA